MRMTDLVCGKRFHLDEAATQHEHDGWLYFFCSAKCHRQFVKAPSQYAEKRVSCNP